MSDHRVAALEENLKKALTELLVLHLLSERECYIGEITELIQSRSNETLNVVFPYSAIYRLQQDGYLKEAEKRVSPDGRRRQYFCITAQGRVHLKQLLATYRVFSAGVDCILSAGGSES